MTKFESAFHSLITNTPFFANVILNSTIAFNKEVPTAGVRIRNRKIEFLFNPEFIDAMNVNELEGLITHEILHIVFGHANMKARRQNRVDHQVWNIAEDCAINQYIRTLPSGGITVESLEKLTGETLEKLQTAEYYYNMLKKHKDKMQFVKTLDEHGFGGDEAESDFLGSDEAQAIIGDVIDKAQKQSNGNVPGNLANVLNLMKNSRINWKQRFRNFVGKAASSSTQHTRKKLNRRHGTLVPGKKKKKVIKIAVCTDSSGSVSDEAYQMFLSETQAALTACESELYLIQADCVVNDVKKYKAGSKISTERKGYGGTAYQPAIDKAMELGVDLIIYAGDGDSADTPKDPKKPFLWLIVGRQKPPGNFGEVIYLDDLK